GLQRSPGAGRDHERPRARGPGARRDRLRGIEHACHGRAGGVARPRRRLATESESGEEAMKKPVPLLSLALCSALAAGATPSSRPSVIAKVNDEKITSADLKTAFTKVHGGHAKFLAGEEEVR